MTKKNIKACLALLAISINVGLQAQENIKDIPSVTQDTVVEVAFGKSTRKDILGAVSTVNVSQLLNKSYGTYSLDNLQSFVSGYTGNIWGQGPLILIDGVDRRPQDVRLVEVESITVLKDAASLALYGSNGSRGVVLITTRRGKQQDLAIDVRANTGISTPKIYPTYLGAAEYMTLYNEASRNDRLAEKYTAEEIYNTTLGTNPYRYPDLKFYTGDYLRKFSTRSDLTTEIHGGNARTKYYNNIGLSYNNSLLKFADSKNNDDFSFNVRTNIDMGLTDWLTANADVVVNMTNQYNARGNFWGMAGSIRPNNDWFHPYVPLSMLDPNNPDFPIMMENAKNIIDGKYLLGGLRSLQTNEMSQILASGYIKNKHRVFMFNVGAKADLSGITPGLSFSSRFSMDYTSRYTEAYSVAYATYEPTWGIIDGKEMITALEKIGNDGNSTNEFIGTSLFDQTLSITTQLNYLRTFNEKHNVSGKLIAWGTMSQFSSDPNSEGGSVYQPVRNTNVGMQANYNYMQKYYVDFSGNVVHSAKLPEHRRRGFSPTATLGWRISQEDFFKDNVSFINDLKITTSYAALKQDLDISNYYMYKANFGNQAGVGGWYRWKDDVNGGYNTLAQRGANPDLTFVERKEFRLGLDAALFNNLLSVNANYFKQNIDGLLTSGGNIFPSYFTGQGNFLPTFNYGIEMRKGVDFSVNVRNKIGKLDYDLGFVGMIYDSEIIKREELNEYAYQNRVGKPLDNFFGYLAEGLFQSQEEIDAHARQTTFGGTIRPGDIKYTDVNGDGMIDWRDQVDLGHAGWAASPFTYGLNLTLKYKNLTFFAMGSGMTGAIGFKNNAYFWSGRGLNKYSEVVLDRWTPETAATATYPRLTTTGESNNFQNSTFWMYKNNRFNLTRVQFTYDLDKTMFKPTSIIDRMSIYVNGDNLLVVAKERKMMETNIGSAPQTRFFNLGVKASF